jgi:short-subunit dehydrogenase
MITVNMKCVWSCMKYEILQSEAQSCGGAIVNISSILGLVGLGNSTAMSLPNME